MARLDDHSHCLYCGDPIPYGREYCDDECLVLRDYDERTERKKDRRFYILVAVSLVAVLAAGGLAKMLL
ncbi:hypothetical protein SDC9_109598 [bioreactor metagenome]|uniref:DUF2116 family Zn-ribbon domain-containing protein n=1 Tax=bioreactor metagenome TaxID=1076179 RepID=A0A645BDJ6_9ZZZZ|nr:DUF2116 family Zn-ribbon domain-containing protein [Candidatus Thermoplasmatota archaeon]